jgi:hypothetical protein
MVNSRKQAEFKRERSQFNVSAHICQAARFQALFNQSQRSKAWDISHIYFALDVQSLLINIAVAMAICLSLKTP